MRKATPQFVSLLILLALSWLLAASETLSLSNQSSQTVTEDSLIEKSRNFLQALQAGDFIKATEDFDETMLKLSGPEKLESFWKQLPGKLGAFRSQTEARRDRLGQYDIVLVTCVFEKITLDARVVFDKNGKISGFQFVPSLPPATYAEPKYAAPGSFEEKDVEVGAADWPLPGTLTLPKNAKPPFPALILVHGSGPNDRDESLGPNKPFRDLALGLAAKGIAVLRYDKRTLFYRDKLTADKSLSQKFTVNEETVEDVTATLMKLKKIAEIDSQRIFILGHSLGGYLIPRIAEATQKIGPAGFIILAGLTRPIEDAYQAQMNYLLALDGELSTEDREKLAEVKKEVETIKSLTEKDLSTEKRYLGAGTNYWLNLKNYNPVAEARIINKPMLILQGDRDYQVTRKDFNNWQEGLKDRSDVTFKLYPRLNHLFFSGQGIITPNEYIQIHGNVSEEVIEDIAAWIKNQPPARYK